GLDLHERLAEAEGGEDGATAALRRPLHVCALVRLQERVDLAGVDPQAFLSGNGRLGAEEVLINLEGHAAPPIALTCAHSDRVAKAKASSLPRIGMSRQKASPSPLQREAWPPSMMETVTVSERIAL